LFFQNSFAQYPILSTTSLAGDPTTDSNFSKKGNYAVDTNNERNQYVGLWRYEQNGVLFELKMEKRDQYLYRFTYNGITDYDYSDVIIFKYKLVKNGITIYDNLNATIPNENYFSSATKYGDYDYLSGRMIDMTRNVNASVSIKRLTATNPDKIYFDLSSGGYSLLNPIEYYQGSNEKLFNIPTDGIEMVMVY
jgi:hypothetical protein